MKKSFNRNLLFALLISLTLSVTNSATAITGENAVAETEYTNRDGSGSEIANEIDSRIAINEPVFDVQLNESKNKSKRKAKRNKPAKTESQPEISDINKNLVSPNESPGLNTDIQKTKRYYESVEGAHRTKIKEDTSGENVIEQDSVQLPARIQKDGKAVHINEVEFFPKSKIFTDDEIAQFKALAEDQDLTAEDLDNLIRIINQQYLKKGVITAKAFLNKGALKGDVLTIELMEAKIGKIMIEGNRFNRKWYLKSQISEKSGDVLNLQTMEKDLKQFNRNARSIKMSAKLKPGEEYGTTDVILQADEQWPYHFSASWDSFGRETTGLLRGGLMVSADSVFGFQDRLSAAVNMARSSTTPFVDYSIPLNRKGTRAGVSYMYGNNKITSGQYKDFDLGANTHITSGYITHPLIDNEKGSLNLNTSANLKFSDAKISGFKYSSFKDYNIAVGLSGHRNFKRSILYGSLYSTNGIIEDRIRDNSRYFTKVNADGYYVHYLPKGIIATFKVGGQYSPCDISYVEQYQIGGISSVRGYSESLLLGPSSYFASLELLFPIPFLPETIKVPFKKDRTFRLRDSVKFATFFDQGAVFPHEGKIGKTNFLMSAGAGIRIALSKFVTARVYVGIPLMNTTYYEQASARAHFDLIVSPF